MRMQRREWLNKHVTTSKPYKPSKTEHVAYMQRVSKRALKAMGEDVSTQENKWLYNFEVNGCRYSGHIKAITKSEARSRLKKKFKIRLPKRLNLIKGETNDED